MPKSDLLIKTHIPKLKGGIFTKHSCKIILQSRAMWISLVLSVICAIILCYKSDLDYLSIITNIVGINLSIFPNILGFCIASYAVIIGFGHKDVLKKMSAPLGKEKSRMSYFQILSCVFVISIIFQAITLFFSFCISYIVNFELHTTIVVAKIVNIATIFIVGFLSSFSLLLIYYVVKNTFIFGQTMHFCIRKEALEDEEKLIKPTHDKHK